VSYDEQLARRIRQLASSEAGMSERRMFGGLAFLVGGNLAVAASGQGGLMVRVPPQASEELAREQGVAPMVMRGRALRGWLRVDADVVRADTELARWVGIGIAFARSLPAK
jgi:TfoX/Sxy family transcriptional regulator of competence genes